MEKTGSELSVGDTIGVWWKGKRDTITAIKPYSGPLAYLWPQGAYILTFALNITGMTVDAEDTFEVYSGYEQKEKA